MANTCTVYIYIFRASTPMSHQSIRMPAASMQHQHQTITTTTHQHLNILRNTETVHILSMPRGSIATKKTKSFSSTNVTLSINLNLEVLLAQMQNEQVPNQIWTVPLRFRAVKKQPAFTTFNLIHFSKAK